MADESIGKVSLDMEVDGDLSKQINTAANKIGEQIKNSLSSINFKGFADKIGSTISKSVDSSMKTVQKTIQDSLDKALSGAAKTKGIKIPVSWEIPKDSIMPRQGGTRVASPRAPPIPKINTGINLEAIKAQIDNLTKSLDITNAKIEQQKEKLAQLKESYNMAFDGARKNKLQEQILQTEANINRLTAQSDKAGFKLADLDAQFEMLSNAAKDAGAGVEVANNKIKESSSTATNASRNLKKLESSARGSGEGFRSGYGGARMFFESMFKWGIVFPLIIGGLGTMAKFVGSAFMTNTQFAYSLNLIKSNLMTAFMPIYQAVLPAINALMSGLATVTAYIASFVSALFGSTYNASFGAAQNLQTAIGAYDQTEKAAKKAATSLGGVGKAATASSDATKKAAKEAKGSLAAFDEINQLQMTKNPSTKEPKTPGSGVVTPITPMANMEPISAATAVWADKFKSILAGLWAPFKQAWAAEGANTIAAAKHALQGIEDLIGSIAKSFYTVWTNGTGEKILANLLKILQDIFNIVGDIGVTFANAWNNGNIGTQIIQTLANSINNVLSLIDKMLQAVRQVWAEEGPTFAALFMQALNAVSGVIENVTQKLGWIWDHGGQHAFEGFVKLGLKIGELALFILTDFVAPFVNWFVNMISPAIAVALDFVGKLLNKMSDFIAWLISSGKAGLATITDSTSLFSKTISDLGQMASNVWNNVLVPFGQFLLGAFSDSINTVIKAATWLWKNVYVPFGDFILWFTSTVILPLAGVLKDNLVIAFNFLRDIATTVWKNVLSPLGDFIAGIFYKQIQSICEIFTFWWNNVLSPLGNFLVTIFKPFIQVIIDAFTWLWKNVLSPLSVFMGGAFIQVFRTVTDSVGGQISSLKSIFSGVIDFITGVFTLNWRQAWNGVREIFAGIFGSLYSYVKTPLNLIIGAINQVISGLDSISFSAPDWVPGVGGKSFGISIPHIPYLARGGIIDQPTLAMVGEAGKEAVVPLENTAFVDTLASAVANAILAAMKLNQGNNGSNNKDNRDIILQLDGTTLGRILKPYLEKENNRIGNSLIIKTT